MKLRFPCRQWEANELAQWLRKRIPQDPNSYFDYWVNNRHSFFFNPEKKKIYKNTLFSILKKENFDELIKKANELSVGLFDYYFYLKFNIGFPSNWHLNPEIGKESPGNIHWSRIPMISKEFGELKNIWEASRFGAAYILSRAYWLTGNEEYPEKFWKLIESWCQSNPPNNGANWRCGQEIAIRIMAWCFALYAMAKSPATTPERVHLLVGMIAAQADRISRTTIYAHLQQNNHAISEGAGLWTVGVLFPELKKAKIWREQGKKILEKEALSLIKEDGSFNQKSNNYHRLMLHDYLYAIRLGEVNGYKFSDEILNRVKKAGEFILGMIDMKSGKVPNIGGNDGALIIPLNDCDYSDFRPVCNCIHYFFNKSRLFDPGPWDEDLFWFFGPEALYADKKNVRQSSIYADQGGYFTLRGETNWAMIRCPSFQDRPSHADALHLDLWINGKNIAIDPGSFSYLENRPWNNSLSCTNVHNTVTVDNMNQMEKGPRFLWTNWLHSTVHHHKLSENGLLAYFEGEHDGYKRLSDPVIHKRAVLMAGEQSWIIIDNLLAKCCHAYQLHWLLDDFPFVVDKDKKRVFFKVEDFEYSMNIIYMADDVKEAFFSCYRGNENSAPFGWKSPTYRVRKPAISISLKVSCMPPCRFITVFSPSKNTVFIKEIRKIIIENKNEKITVYLNSPNFKNTVHFAQYENNLRKESLKIN